eukprot:gb/GFBE01074381.1/.p1 GENE.gb/GFBE01074381.1/~~gb/GFBE01074381.1/.p1  ORF type:complete len:355 (+),score=65.31 gb/GFBE01074381.1/:1-1065(+)
MMRHGTDPSALRAGASVAKRSGGTAAGEDEFDEMDLVDFATYLELEKLSGPLDMSSLCKDAASAALPEPCEPCDPCELRELRETRAELTESVGKKKGRKKKSKSRGDLCSGDEKGNQTLLEELYAEIGKLPREDHHYVEKLLSEQRTLRDGLHDLARPASFAKLLGEGKMVWAAWMPYMAGYTLSCFKDNIEIEATSKFAEAISLDCFRLDDGRGGLLERKGYGSCVTFEQATRARSGQRLTEACKDKVVNEGHPGRPLDALAQQGRLNLYRRRALLDFVDLTREVLHPNHKDIPSLVVRWFFNGEPLRAPRKEGLDTCVDFTNKRLARYEEADLKADNLWSATFSEESLRSAT